MDIRQQQATYQLFMKMTKWGAGFIVVLLIRMATFLVHTPH